MDGKGTLTEDEHHTRAMLLGGRYKDWVGVYEVDGQNLDAVTLAPVDEPEYKERLFAEFDRDVQLAQIELPRKVRP